MLELQNSIKIINTQAHKFSKKNLIKVQSDVSISVRFDMVPLTAQQTSK